MSASAPPTGIGAGWALLVMRQLLSPVYLNTNGRHTEGAYGQSTRRKTAHTSSRQTVFTKAESQISPTLFGLISPLVVDFEADIVSLLYRSQNDILPEAHYLLPFLAAYYCQYPSIPGTNLSVLKRENVNFFF